MSQPLPPEAPALILLLPLFRACSAALAQELWLYHPPLGHNRHRGSMADEDLIFPLEGIDGSQTPGASQEVDSEADSDEDEGYFICPITEDPRAHQNDNSKVNNYYSNLTKSEHYGFSASPVSSFNFKVSGLPSPSALALVTYCIGGQLGSLVDVFPVFPDSEKPCKFWV